MTEDDEGAIERLTVSVDRLVRELRAQTLAVETAVAAMARYRRLHRMVNVAVVSCLVLSAVVAVRWRADTQHDEELDCRASNELRTAVIRASSESVRVALLELDRVDTEAEARQAADVVAAALDDDPGLRPRAC